jgi:Activator of Hsp90 ATPase homolog 1-like protein
MAAAIDPVRQSVEVELELDQAFELFTTGIAEWWPYKTHFSRGPVETLIFEPRLGGELKEVCSDGVVATYGLVVVWDPPNRVVIRWMVAPERNPATEVDVRFVPLAAGTRVELVHRGFEAYGDERGPQARDSYANGWPGVLARFAREAATKVHPRRSS